MIKITAELISYGVGEPKLLGTLEIANDGTGDLVMGNYRVRLKDRRGRVRRKGRVEGFWRAKQSVWVLTHIALGNLLKRGGWIADFKEATEEDT